MTADLRAIAEGLSLAQRRAVLLDYSARQTTREALEKRGLAIMREYQTIWVTPLRLRVRAELIKTGENN